MDRPQCLHPESLQLQIRSSRIAGYYCAVVMLLSWLGIGLAGLPWYFKILLSLAAAACGWQAFFSLRVLATSMLELSNGNWILHRDNGLQEVLLEKKIFLGAGIISLPFRLQSGGSIRLMLWPDSADAESLRQLRAALLAL